MFIHADAKPSTGRRGQPVRIGLVFGAEGDAARLAARGVLDFARDGREMFPQSWRNGSVFGWLPTRGPDWSIVLDGGLIDRAVATGSTRERLDGVIGCLADRRFASLARLGLPAVGIACGPQAVASPVLGVAAEVQIDAEVVVRLAVEQLVGCGIVMLGYLSASSGDLTAEAFCRRSRSARRPAEILPPVATDHGVAVRAVADWLRERKGPIGLLAGDDRCGGIVLEAALRLGRRVPGDVFVVGVGNDELLCESAAPTLTSIDPGLRQLGAAAAGLLHAVLSGRGQMVPRRLALEPAGVVCRDSTAGLVVGDEKVAEAVRLLRANLAFDITPAALARRVGLSRVWLDERFKRAFGRTVHGEIVNARVAEVRRLLEEPGTTIKQVAAACGFNSTQYMTTFMRQHTGDTPGRLRNYRLARPHFTRPRADFNNS